MSIQHVNAISNRINDHHLSLAGKKTAPEDGNP